MKSEGSTTRIGVAISLMFALALLVTLAADVSPQQQALTLDKASAKLVQQLYAGKIGARALFASTDLKLRGTKIATWRDPAKLSVETDGYFFFVDEQPGANWEHKAKYVLVDKQTGALNSVDVKTPPTDILKLRAMSPAANAQLPLFRRNLELVAQIGLTAAVALKKEAAYAVLVSGGWNPDYNYGRYWNDLASIFKALKQKYGYTDDQIIVLYANGTHNPSTDLDGDGVGDIDYAATKANLTTVFNHIRSTIASDGKLFFYSTNHGGQEAANSYNAVLYLWGEWIRDDELAALSKGIKCKEMDFVMEQCYSGGMMDDLLQAQQPYPCISPKVCISTAANYNEPSWACDTEGEYDEYVYHWTSAVFGKTPAGAAVNADTNHDGKISMEEAHQYAKSHDSAGEHPTIGSCVNDACNASLVWKLLLRATPVRIR